LASNAILYFGLRKTTLQELKPMQDETFKKLGQFYLGKQFDMDRRERTDQHLLYDSRDLCTQAVVVGMTGSGKTVLRIDLLEEAAMDNIPAIVIDPKGDISNLLLTFPGLSAEEFLPLD
jgi:polynucleotide 5'-kinase involved in rRNA processing